MTFEEKMEQYGRHLAKETVLETARKLKQEGIPIETIAKCTDLSPEEIEQL